MAFANAPRGASPIGNVGGNDWNQQGRMYAIASDGTNTYAIGDIVKTAAGTDTSGVPYVVKATSGDVPVGIIVGIRVADPGVSLVAGSLDLTKTYIGLSAGTRYVYVVDDPDVLFEIQMDSTAITLANLHKNSNMTITADQTSTLSSSAPFSNTVLTGSSVNTTNTFIVRMIGMVQRDDNAPTSATVGGAYCKVLCKWNCHEYSGSTGFTAA